MDLATTPLAQLVVVTLCCGGGQLVKGVGGAMQKGEIAVDPWWYEEAQSGMEKGSIKGNILSFRFSRKVNLRVGAESWLPHIKVTRDPSKGTTTIKGPVADFLRLLANSLNFTYTLVNGDGYFGAPIGDGKWNGMIGMLKRREIDIALGPFAMSHERRQVADFTIPLLMEKMKIMVMRPKPEPNPWGLVAPFSWYVWFGVASTFFVMAFVSFCIVRCLETGGPMEARDHLWGSFAILITQALAWQPKGFTLRFLLSVWMLCCIVIVNSYSGSLTSLLAVTTVSASHDSLQDVLEDKELSLIMEANTAFTSHLKKVQDGIYKDLAEAAAKRGIFEPADNLWRKSRRLLLGKRHALLAEELTLLKFIADDMSLTGRCDFHISSGEFWPVIVSMAVAQGSPLLHHINARVLTLREYGIYDAWLGRELDNVTQCVLPDSRLPLLPYTLTDLWLAFLFLGGGLVAASVTLMCELWWDRKRLRRQVRRAAGRRTTRRFKLKRRRLSDARDRLILDSNSETKRNRQPSDGRLASQSMSFERNFSGVQFFRQEGGGRDDNFVVFLRADVLRPGRARENLVEVLRPDRARESSFHVLHPERTRESYVLRSDRARDSIVDVLRPERANKSSVEVLRPDRTRESYVLRSDRGRVSSVNVLRPYKAKESSVNVLRPDRAKESSVEVLRPDRTRESYVLRSDRARESLVNVLRPDRAKESSVDVLRPDRARESLVEVPRGLDADTIVLGEKTEPLRGGRAPPNRVLEIVKVKPPKPRFDSQDRGLPPDKEDSAVVSSDKVLGNERH
ncbi:glutamate receptor 1-like [Penaeus japonicus]|uniref:glutamate receptor 1-like n=1 Tax=Penaeus japonicus TaxID=27405 RepID=UPI001C712A1D|nr:glutamate receptor 1-like [Penaeus japonicus]